MYKGNMALSLSSSRNALLPHLLNDHWNEAQVWPRNASCCDPAKWRKCCAILRPASRLLGIHVAVGMLHVSLPRRETPRSHH